MYLDIVSVFKEFHRQAHSPTWWWLFAIRIITRDTPPPIMFTHAGRQNGSIFFQCACSQLRSNKAKLCLLFFFFSCIVFHATFSLFWICVGFVDGVIASTPTDTRMKCAWCLWAQEDCVWCIFWRKRVRQVLFVWALVLSETSSVLKKHPYIK